MYPSVQTYFVKFSSTFEGCVSYMYLDILGLVTVGVGNLIDPVELALALPFRFKNRPGLPAAGTLASREQIGAEWQKLKRDQSLGQKGAKACEPLTDLQLDDSAIEALIVQILEKNETFLKNQPPFRKYDTWPADAQLGLLSMAWAMGPAGPGNFPKFSAACRNLDFVTAAAECRMNEAGNPGIVARNVANRTLFSNAARVSGLDPTVLHYPRILP